MRRALVLLGIFAVVAGTVLALRLNSTPVPEPPSAPCPEEELSCGKQRPVISDGRTPFINEEMQIQATFPKGSPVCMTRSGDAARGFYAVFDPEDMLCSEAGSIRSALTISSSWNAMDFAAPREAIYDNCKPLETKIAATIGNDPLAIPGLESVVCMDRKPNRTFSITVFALGNSRQDGSGLNDTLYWAVISTTDAALAADVGRFREFLDTLAVG